MQSLIALGDVSLVGVEMYLFSVFELFDVNHWDNSFLNNFQWLLFVLQHLGDVKYLLKPLKVDYFEACITDPFELFNQMLRVVSFGV